MRSLDRGLCELSQELLKGQLSALGCQLVYRNNIGSYPRTLAIKSSNRHAGPWSPNVVHPKQTDSHHAQAWWTQRCGSANSSKPLCRGTTLHGHLVWMAGMVPS